MYNLRQIFPLLIVMDRLSCAVIQKIGSLAPVGRYVIISEEEFFECFPEDAQKSESELRKALRSLSGSGYIDMKYSSGDLYCVAQLKKYLPEPTPEPIPVPVKSKKKKIAAKICLSPFWAAFLGGVTGSLIISLVFSIINYVG